MWNGLGGVVWVGQYFVDYERLDVLGQVVEGEFRHGRGGGAGGMAGMSSLFQRSIRESGGGQLWGGGWQEERMGGD